MELCGRDIDSRNLCTFCFKGNETLIHLFCGSKVVGFFLNNVFNWILTRFRINISSSNLYKSFKFHKRHLKISITQYAAFIKKILDLPVKYSNTKSNMLQYFMQLNQ